MSNKHVTSKLTSTIEKPQKAGAKLPTSSRVVTKDVKGKTKTKKVVSGEKLMSSRVIGARDAKELSQLGKDFLTLHENAVKRMDTWKENFNVLREKLLLKNAIFSLDSYDPHIPSEVLNKALMFVRESVVMHRDLTAAVINTLRATHKVLALVDISEAMEANGVEVKKVIEDLNLVQQTVNKILQKDLKDFTAKDLQTLKSSIEMLGLIINSAIDSIHEKDFPILEKQVQNFQEMSEVFDQAQALWTGVRVGAVTETKEETRMQLEEDKEISKILKDAMDAIKAADIDDARFWGGIAALIGALSLSLLLAAILVGLLASGVGALVGVIFLGMLAGVVAIGAVATPFIAPGVRYDTTYTHIQKNLEELLNLAPPLAKDLKKIESQQ